MFTLHRRRSPRRPRSGSSGARGGVLLRLRGAHELIAHALAAFVLTFVAGPCLHNFNHRADHVHAEAGEGAAHGHEHGHEHGREHAGGGDAAGGVESAPVHGHGGGHGKGSVAHFGAAVMPSPFVVIAPPITVEARLAPVVVTVERPRTPPRGLPDARGPPA